MIDEFDDDLEIEEVPDAGVHMIVERAAPPHLARLVARLYGAASASLRTRILSCLIRPLGSLGLAAVASGAFAQLLYRSGEAGAGPIGDLAGYSKEQVFELARFVDQVSPDAIQQVAGLLSDNPVGLSAFGAAVALLLARAVKGLRLKHAGPRDATTARWQFSNLGDGTQGVGNKKSSGYGSTTALNELVRRTRERPGAPGRG